MRTFARFWWDFLVGDDWTIAVGVLAALAATWALHHDALAAWWLPPLAGAGVLALAVRRYR